MDPAECYSAGAIGYGVGADFNSFYNGSAVRIDKIGPDVLTIEMKPESGIHLGSLVKNSDWYIAFI